MKHIPHIFLDCEDIRKNIINNIEEYNHLINVLKLKKNSKLNILDNKGNIFYSEITEILNKKIFFKINEKKNHSLKKNKLCLVQSVLKINAFEEILDKSTQLGIDEIYPIITDNTTLKIDIFKSKYNRFNKILKSSSEQSKRFFIPRLNDCIYFKDFKNFFNKNNTIIAFENADFFMKEIIKDYTIKENNFIVCGPEGGFSDNEIKFFKKNEYNLFKVSENILRSETAVLSIISNFIYEFESQLI
jgi:16S rRNA (uracil1498-N3)-methyltransferase